DDRADHEGGGRQDDRTERGLASLVTWRFVWLHVATAGAGFTDRSERRNVATQSAPIPSGATTSIHVSAARGRSAGTTRQNTATSWTAATPAASKGNVRALRFASRDSSTRNGNPNCATARNHATAPQPARLRSRYHGTSSGRLPDHITISCENAR